MEPMKPMKPMKPMERMKPMTPLPEEQKWWPHELGEPSSSGAQNTMRYAFFPDKRRLLIERDGKLATYDTGTHRISGVSQASSEEKSVMFSSQDGPIELGRLKQMT